MTVPPAKSKKFHGAKFITTIVEQVNQISFFLRPHKMKTQHSPPSSYISLSIALMARKLRLSPLYLLTSLTSTLFLFVLYTEDLSWVVSQIDPNVPSKNIHHHHHHHSLLIKNNNKKPLKLLFSVGPMEDAVNTSWVQEDIKRNNHYSSYKRNRKPSKLPFSVGQTQEGCNIFDGSWVRDKTNRPLYEEHECPYIEPQLTCQEHGRPEKEYQFWRWQPRRCSLPSFNAPMMLETLRNKRMLFVGDSLNRGQHVSLVCLLHRLIPEDAKSMETNGALTIFRAKEYNATIEFYWAPFLLESNSDDAVVHRLSDRIVRRGSINKHGKQWKGADIVVFNTYLWWMTGMKFKTLKDGSFDDEVKEIVELSTEGAYRMALRSMLRWIAKNMDPKKTRVFFTSMSPSHNKSIDWGGEPNGNCYNETAMIQDPTYWGSDSRRTIMQVIGEVFRKSKVPISLLNITQLSSYRRDAHTSIYKKQWNPLTPEQIANPTSYADCVHWCLPGLQDTWNELLFAKLFYP